MTFRELVTEVRKLVGEGYFSIKQEYTQHSNGEEKVSYSIYSGTSYWGDEANTKEEALENFKRVLKPAPKTLSNEELEADL